MAVQEGARFLEKSQGGQGVLLGGVPGVLPGKVVILGGGVVGTNAAKTAAGLGAWVCIIDNSLPRLRHLDDVMPRNVTCLFGSPQGIRKQIEDADLVIGAVLVPGARTPCLIRKADLRKMKPGAVVVDVAVDQGGCVETTRPTTHRDPVYLVGNVVHYAVPNMPGAVPRTSTLALTNATLPYAVALSGKGWKKACLEDGALKLGVDAVDGKLTHRGVADAFGMPWVDVDTLLQPRSGT
jgi:alanine dehydrogenase